jgi:hypothetical protein
LKERQKGVQIGIVNASKQIRSLLTISRTEAFFKEFLKTTNKQKIVSPPTEFEKALIIQEPIPIRLKTPKKIILPTFVENMVKEKKKTTRNKK